MVFNLFMKNIKYFIVTSVLLAFTLFFSDSLFAQGYTSSWNTCHAYTDCWSPWGYQGRVSCVVYGSGHSHYWGSRQSMCSWSVIPNHSVRCTGFVRQVNRFGQVFWQWAHFNPRCPGRF